MTKLSKHFFCTGLFFLTLFVCSPSFAQSKKRRVHRTVSDSLRAAILYRDSLMRTLKTSDTSLNNLLQKFEDYTVVLTKINNSINRGLDTAEISQDLPNMERVINKVKSSVSDDKSTTLRFLYNLRNILTRRQEALDVWQDELNDISSTLIQTQNELANINKDATLNNAPADSALQSTFLQQRERIHRRWQKLDSINSKNLVKIGYMQNRTAAVYISMIDAQDQISYKIRGFNTKALSCEYGYFWDKSSKNTGMPFAQATKSTIDINSILLNYYINGNILVHLCGLALFVTFFSWLYTNRKRVIKRKATPQEIFDQTNYTARHPFISSVLLTAVIVPYFYNHPPAVFLEIFYLVMIVCIILLVRMIWPRQLLNFMMAFLLVTLVYGLSNLYTEVSYADRTIMLIMAAASTAIGYRLIVSIRKSKGEYPSHAILILKIFMGLQAMSFICNVFGRFTLAKIIAVTSAFSFWLAFGLYLFVQVMMESLFLQLEANKSNTGITSYFDFKIIQSKFKSILSIGALVLWFIMLFQNLSIEDAVFDFLGNFLNATHEIGSTGTIVTFGGILIFIGVIWLSSVVARIVTYFYDFASQHSSDTVGTKRKNRNSILLVRIGIFSVGFLLAVAASGFPLDKITIIVSALGVGVGFGLQNIVNNLVSGLILAFEKPIQIGDIVEVAGKSGVIKEIGIRSSKIATGDGAEVILPNGDLISQAVINWTLSNSNRRVELVIGVAYGSDIEKVKGLLKGILDGREDIMTNPAPLVLLNNLNESTVDFRVLFWAADISVWQELKSRILADIYNTLNAEGINIPFPQRDVNVHLPQQIIDSFTQKAADPNQ